MKNKTKGLLFQLPGIIILVAAVIGSFVGKIIYPELIRFWATPITILIIGVLYFVGMYYSLKHDNPYY